MAEGGAMLHWVLVAVCGISLVVQFRLNCAEAYGILVPWPGIKPASPALEARFLTIGPSGKFPALLYERKERELFWSVDPMGQQTKVGVSTSNGMLPHYRHCLGQGSVVSISGRRSDQVRTKAMLTPTCSRCSPKFSKTWGWNQVSGFFFFFFTHTEIYQLLEYKSETNSEGSFCRLDSVALANHSGRLFCTEHHLVKCWKQLMLCSWFQTDALGCILVLSGLAPDDPVLWHQPSLLCRHSHP